MTLSVVGMGLVSAAGRSPEEHAFFMRARVPAPAASPFELASGSSLDVRFCHFIGARAPIVDRMRLMAEKALDDALEPVKEALSGVRLPLFFCASRPRPGLSEAQRLEVEEALAKRMGASEVTRHWQEAGAFAALIQAEAMLEKGEARAAVIVAVDSYVSLEALCEDVVHPIGPWAGDRLPRAEGAAALVVMTEAAARRAGLSPEGLVVKSATAVGEANDDNDEIIDGTAMTTALRALPAAGPIQLAFGQETVDPLRRREWFMAHGRTASRFDVACVFEGIEDRLGVVGAAAGAMNLVYGIAVLRHDAAREEIVPGASAVAWAISRDGTRGAAVLRGVES